MPGSAKTAPPATEEVAKAQNPSILDDLDRNAVLNVASWAAAIYLSFWLNSWLGLLLYPAILGVADLLYYFAGLSVLDPEIAIARGYQISAAFNDTLHSQGLDYGFNFYDGDYDKPRHQAQQDKFEYAFKQLGLKPGMSVIDVGCGCGDWLHWLKHTKKCDVVGVNITLAQVEECRKRGLNVVWSNWKTLDITKEGLKNRFDAVTFWDTVEHYVNMKDVVNRPAQQAVYEAMFQLAYDLMDPDSPSRRIFISCLHMRKKVVNEPFGWTKVYKLYYCYLLDKFHSGCYPDGANGRMQLVENAERKKFKLIHKKDTTMDYFKTSVLEPTHFGKHVFKWTPQRLRFAAYIMLVDPAWFHRILWYYSSDWMLQFDPKDISNSDMIHWWLVFESV